MLATSLCRTAQAQAELDRDSGPRKSLCRNHVLSKVPVRQPL